MAIIITIVVGLLPFFVSLLSFFSGFGINTLLLPVFSILISVEAAVFITAIVHLLNNLFKLLLMIKHVDKKMAVRFGIPAVGGAFVGAFVLAFIANQPALFAYQIANYKITVSITELVIGILIILFALTELVPKLMDFKINPKWVWAGGVISGFFGGLSGHQGAIRSLFLLKSGLKKNAFIATGIIIACAVDIMRISVYTLKLEIFLQYAKENFFIIFVATISAWLGAWLGRKILPSISIKSIHFFIGALLVILGALIATGIL